MRVVLATVPTPGDRVRKGESLGLRYLAAIALRYGHEVFIREATDVQLDDDVFARSLLSLFPLYVQS